MHLAILVAFLVLLMLAIALIVQRFRVRRTGAIAQRAEERAEEIIRERNSV